MSFPSWVNDIPELFPFSRGGIVRLPELIGAPYSSRVARIIDHPYFQRLRKVKQLSLIHLVYPGAQHTRFEHALGVFETCGRYILSLLSDKRSKAFTQRVTRQEIEALLLAGLLHDLGHYPFAHLLEALHHELDDHVDLLAEFLRGTIADRYPSLRLPRNTPSLESIIKQDWNQHSLDDICFFVSGKPVSASYTDDERNHKSILRSMLDGPIDADKMDYLYRDSLHCGVPYGRFIDRDRLFQSLTVDPVTNNRIAITEKGRISMELFAYARSAMYSEVYWHHAGRAVTAMVNRAIRASTHIYNKIQREEMVDLLINRSDEQVVQWLSGQGDPETKQLMGLIHQRRLYKRLLVLDQRGDKDLFELLDRLRWDRRADFDAFNQTVVDAINEQGLLYRARPLAIQPHEVLIDVPYAKKGLPRVTVCGEQGVLSNDDQYVGVWEGIGNDFERYVRKIRVYLHPDIAEALSASLGAKHLPHELRDKLKVLLKDCAQQALTKVDQPLKSKRGRTR